MLRSIVFLLAAFVLVDAHAATVHKKMKKGRIRIDEGKNNGFEKGKEVCIYAEDETEITCAKIIRAKNKRSYIKIRKKKTFRKIKKGMAVKLKEGISQEATAEGGELTPTPASRGTNIKVGYVLSPMTPSVYNALYYADPNETAVNTLWKADRTASLSLAGAGIEFGLGIGSFDLNLGFRVRQYKPFTIRANYTPNRSFFSETDIQASSQGVWIDFTYLKLQRGTFSIDVGTGIDIDISNVTMETRQKDDNDTTDTLLYEVTSDLTTISLRLLNLNLNFFFDPIGFQLGSSVLLPVSASASESITVEDPQATSFLTGIEAEEDVKQALNHRKNDVGFEFFVSTFYAF
ncbi:MAG: hypothetical protein HRU19_14920 [Pseudobacteriovorax sp.]|nr:hypothetical protein [Pseudobacteriovorax sp.]